jgi:NAD(P)-dependent dehydrogenase (short-subunit alcohol dehydrogenase family)
VVTGGNSGIGLAIATLFRAEGARLSILGRDKKTLDRAVSELGEDTLGVQGDVTRMGDTERLFKETSEHLGKVDVLVVNAGIAKFAPLSDFTEELFDEICVVNFKGAFFTVQRALPHLSDGASVILVSSAGACTRGRPLTSVYNATKAAVRSLARTLAAELGERGIRINVLSPGMTETPILSRDTGLSNEVREKIAAGVVSEIPAGRLAQPSEVARAALFLASMSSAYCQGSELTIDGGLTEI